MNISAIILDFDGVITDTEPVHMEAWLGVLEPLGISFDEKEYRLSFLGLNDLNFLDAVGKKFGRRFGDPEKLEMTDIKSKATLELLKNNIPLMPGIKDLIENYKNTYPLSICSGAAANEIDFILNKLKWSDVFDPIISGQSVKKGKPDPEGYLMAFDGVAKRINKPILAKNVLAIEDSPKGVAAASKAGLSCLALSHTFSGDELKKAGAKWVIPSLEGLNISEHFLDMCLSKN